MMYIYKGAYSTKIFLLSYTYSAVLFYSFFLSYKALANRKMS